MATKKKHKTETELLADVTRVDESFVDVFHAMDSALHDAALGHDLETLEELQRGLLRIASKASDLALRCYSPMRSAQNKAAIRRLGGHREPA